MKKIKLISALVAVLAFVLFLSNSEIVKAGTTNASVVLNITAGTNTCTYTSGTINMGTTGTMYATRDVTNNLGTRSCADMLGNASWSLQAQMVTGLLNMTNAAYPIFVSNITMKADANTVTAGSCTQGTNTTTYTILSGALDIVRKASAAGQICTVSAANVTLKVTIPANQAVGSYSGTMIVTYP